MKLAVSGGTIAGMSTALRELLIRHVDAGPIPGGVALIAASNIEVVSAGAASIRFCASRSGSTGIRSG